MGLLLQKLKIIIIFKNKLKSNRIFHIHKVAIHQAHGIGESFFIYKLFLIIKKVLME